MRLVAYCRVSTEEQAKEGVSLAAQRARLEAAAAAFGHELAAVIDDAGVSAKSLKRPGLKRALKMLRAGEAGGLIVTKLDRLTRSTRDMIDLVDKYFASGKAGLISLGESIDTGSAMGRMVLKFFATIAEWEREAIAERTREALRHKQAGGARLGAVPLGFRRDGDALVVDQAEQRVVARALELEANGAKLSAIAATLKAEGHRTKRGGDWHLTTVRKLLARAHPRTEHTTYLQKLDASPSDLDRSDAASVVGVE
jgi:site-specific DNA recombinase